MIMHLMLRFNGQRKFKELFYLVKQRFNYLLETSSTKFNVGYWLIFWFKITVYVDDDDIIINKNPSSIYFCMDKA